MNSDWDGAVRPTSDRDPNGWHGMAMPPARTEDSPTTPIDTPDVLVPTRETARDDPAPGNSEIAESPTTPVSGRLSDLSGIRAVAFSCVECQTVVSLPRIRWANSPENCPNCGARWMRKPSPDTLFPDDDSTYVYRVVASFREALQRLIRVKPATAFQLLLEIDESPDHKQRGSTESRRNGRSHA